MAVDTDLTTLTKVKTYLGISDSDSDTLLGTLIDAASKAIKNYCHDNFDSTEYTEYHDGPRTEDLVLKHRPIISITDIWDDPDRDYEDGDKLDADDDDYVSYADEGIIRAEAHTWNEGNKNIKITYTAGYTSIPADVDLSCQIQVAYWYNRADKGADAADSERLGDYAITYAKSDAARGQVCDDARVLISTYRNLQI